MSKQITMTSYQTHKNTCQNNTNANFHARQQPRCLFHRREPERMCWIVKCLPNVVHELIIIRCFILSNVVEEIILMTKIVLHLMIKILTKLACDDLQDVMMDLISSLTFSSRGFDALEIEEPMTMAVCQESLKMYLIS